MTLSLRRKRTIISLVFYWTAIFILAHIPIPQLVRQAHVSDKILHFLAYLILVFLLWFSIKPDRKVNWRRAGVSKRNKGRLGVPAVWWVFLVMAGYGLVDELLQGCIGGRNCDVMDFAANLAGVLAGLILFSFLTFWSALLVVTGAAIFLLTNLAKANPADLLPVTNTIFHLFAYVFFTMLWIRWIRLFLRLKAPETRWLIISLALPMVFLFIVRLFSVICSRDFSFSDVILSLVAIAAVVATNYLTALFRRSTTQSS